LIFSTTDQARNQLGTPGGAKRFTFPNLLMQSRWRYYLFHKFELNAITSFVRQMVN